MANPLKDVVTAGKKLLDLAGEDPPNDGLREYKQNEARREYAQDIVGRAETVSFAFDRLHALTPELQEIWKAIDAKRPKTDEAVEIPKELIEGEDRLNVEADAMTALIYYESKSIVDMLRELRVDVPKATELEYLLRVRDRFLAHPKPLGVARRANRGGSIPVGEGFLQRNAVNLDTLDNARAAADGLTKEVRVGQWPEERIKNEETLRSRETNEKLPQEQITRLMAFGIRDPDVPKVIGELAQLLATAFLPIVQEYASEAIEKWGLEPVPEGPIVCMRFSAFTEPGAGSR